MRVGGAELEVEALGEGEPVVVVQTALSRDELRPLAERLAAVPGLRVIHYHRRGYGDSSAAVPGSTMRDLAADCRALVDELGVAPVHLVGVSFSSAIALTLAATWPSRVHTLTVVEPPPLHGAGATEFGAVNAALLSTYETHGARVALEEFMTMLVGRDWRERSEADLPGSVAAMERDAPTFFSSDVPALRGWQPDGAELARVRCPVLSVGGGDSGPLFAEARKVLRRWLPQTEEATVDGAGHLLATTHADELAALVSGFLRRHPLTR